MERRFQLILTAISAVILVFLIITLILLIVALAKGEMVIFIELVNIRRLCDLMSFHSELNQQFNIETAILI